MQLQLQSRLSNCEIIKPGRILIKEDELNKVSRKMLQPRYFILVRFEHQDALDPASRAPFIDDFI